MNHALASTDSRSSATGSDVQRTAAAGERLSHLFRVSLRSGRIHPLYLPILKYRQHSKAGE